MVFTSTIWNAVKLTLNKIVTDKSRMTAMDMTDWCMQGTMSDAWVDDLSRAGPGLAVEKPEGAEITTGQIREEYTTRYLARTFALKLHVTEEADEDNKYSEVIDAAGSLVTSMYLTADIDATNLLVRAFDTNYPLADGLPLGSASHTLAGGGTFSNILATPVAPSVSAFVTAQAAIGKMPGHHGITLGYKAKRIVCPMEQWGVWEGILGSSFRPGVENEINVVNRKFPNVSVSALKHWGNTSTNWGIITDAPNGMQFKWRIRPASRTWVDNDQGVLKYAIRARWDKGCSDPRGVFLSNS